MYQDDQNDINQIKLDIGLLKKDHEQMETITNKLSVTIEKIQEMNGNLLRMIALHDQKHEQHQKVEDGLKDDIKELHSRITTITRELHDKIDEIERTIGTKIDILRDDIKKHEADDVAGGKVRNILEELTRYKWMIMGAVLAVGWLISRLNMSVIGTLFK